MLNPTTFIVLFLVGVAVIIWAAHKSSLDKTAKTIESAPELSPFVRGVIKSLREEMGEWEKDVDNYCTHYSQRDPKICISVENRSPTRPDNRRVYVYVNNSIRHQPISESECDAILSAIIEVFEEPTRRAQEKKMREEHERVAREARPVIAYFERLAAKDGPRDLL